MADGSVSTWPRVSLGEVLRRRALDVDVVQSETYAFAGVQSFGRGVFRSVVKRGSEFAYPKLTRVRAGDVTFPKLMAWEGAIGVVPQECDGLVVSPEFPVFEIDRGRATPDYLDLVLRRESFWPQLGGGSTGTNVRRRRLHPDDFTSIAIPLPPLTEQQRIVARVADLCAKVDEATRLRAEQVAHIQAIGSTVAAGMLTGFPTAPVRPLREVVRVLGGGTPSKHDPSLWEGAVPWVSPKDMKQRCITDSQDHISERALECSAAKAISPGAALVVTRGMILARTVPVALLGVRAAINQDMKALVARDSGLVPEYLVCALQASEGSLLARVEKSSHDTRKLETDRLLDIAIPLPPITEQRALVTRFNAMWTATAELQHRVQEVDDELVSLRNSIIERGVRGEL